MFDLDPGKLIVIGIVALIAIPSKDLPRVMRALGQAMGKMRRMSAEFQGQFMEAMREMEAADLRKEIEETNKAIMGGSFDPLGEARKQITDAVEDAPKRVAVPNAPAQPTEDPDDVMAAFADAPQLGSPQEESPHPEEARSAVSKDAPEGEAAASFETPAAQAPQHEVGDNGASQEAEAAKKASS